jgi:putative ABC transport system ATP-binding protein
LLSVRGVVRRHGREQAAVLRGVDCDLARGEFVAIVGRSGSGKSTLLNVLGAMDRADAGGVLYEGSDLNAWDDAARTRFRRRQLGFVFQAMNLLPTLTVQENIALPLELNGLLDRTYADSLAEKLGLSALTTRFPDQLSGGEQQRAAIARALVHRPALVIADEPTGNLDRVTADDVLAVLLRAVRDAGCALLMATHSTAMLEHADRVLELRDGRLHERS